MKAYLAIWDAENDREILVGDKQPMPEDLMEITAEVWLGRFPEDIVMLVHCE